MKTVGEILKNKRAEKKVTLENVEDNTKIRRKFLEALESDNWQKLPSLTYARGFIKNYGEYLGLDTAYILSVFRRQLGQSERQKIIPAGVTRPLNEPFLRITPGKILTAFIAFLLLIFFFWLFGQYKAAFIGPQIVLESPKENELIKSEKIILRGRIDSGAVLTLNGQELEVKEGRFLKELNISGGITVLTLEATNKFGKKTELKRTVRVENSEEQKR